MELYTVNHCLPLLFILFAVEANETSYNVTESAREPRGSRRVVKQYSGTRPDPILCTAEGFRSDPTNCAVFYRCMKSGRGRYTAFKFQCAPGTVYDPDNEVCNHPHSIKRMGCGIDITSTSQQPYENEIEEQRQELPSPISTKKPIYTEIASTAYPWLISSKHQNNELTTRESSTTFHTMKASSQIPLGEPISVVTTNPLLTSTRIHRSTTTRKSSITRQPSPQNGDLCTSEGFMGDSENCRKFYRCVDNQRGGYIRYEFLCSETTIWDDDIRSCNHAWAVKRRRCGRGTFNENNEVFAIQKDQKNPNITQVQQQINYGSQMIQTQSQISDSPRRQNQSQINYGDRNNERKPANQINYSNEGVQTDLPKDHINESSQSLTPETSAKLSTTTIKENSGNNNDYTTMKPSTGTNANVCTESGFMGDQNDCTKFYRCVDNGKGYTRFEFSCGEGTVWDSKLEACNHAWAVKECGGKIPSQSTTAITEIKTTTKPSITTAATTKSTQHFVPTTQTMATDENEDVGYGNQNQFPSTMTTTTAKATSITSTIKSTTQNLKPGVLCTSSGFMGDEYDCKKFYRCVDNGNGAYTRYEFSCGEGTVWDSKIEACNHAWAVEKCGKSSTHNIHEIETTTNKQSASTTTTSTTISTSQITSPIPTENDDIDTGYGIQQDELPSSSIVTSTTTIHTTSGKPINNSNNNCISSGFMGDNNDCKKFYRCVDNGNGAFTRYEFTCGEGTVWDPKIDACNHAWAVEKCGGSFTDIYKEEITTGQPTSTTTSTQMTAVISNEDNDIDTGYGQQIQSSSAPSTTVQQQQNQELAINECKSSGFIGDSNDCKKFYRCVDNGNGSYTRYEFTCGEGTVWDPKIEACNHFWAVEKCGGNYIHKEETTTSRGSTTFSSTQTVAYSDNDYDSGYGAQEEATLSTTTTKKSEKQNNKCKSSGFMGDSSDCKKFYRCVDNGNGGYTRYEFTCGDGTVWDSKIEACNHEWAVEKCGHSNETTSSNLQTTANPKPTTTNDEEIDNGYPQNTEKEPNRPTDTAITTSATSKPGKDICLKEGFIGDEKDCKVFYRCVHDQKGGFIMYEFRCGEGTVWDSEINSCNHIHSVKRPCNAVFTERPQSNSEQTTTQSSGTQSYTEAQTASTSKKPISTSSCTQEGFVRDEYDCKKFYRCVDNGHGGYNKYEFTCGDGTVWNQEIQACDHDTPDRSCSGSGAVNKEPGHKDPEHDEIVIDKTTEEPVSSNDYTSASAGTTQPPQKPSGQCSTEGFYGDTNDCKKFYRCVDNGKGGFTKYDFTCGDGTIWDQEIQACNHESDSKCSASMNVGSAEESFGSTSSTTSTYTELQQANEIEETSTSSTSGEDRCTSEGFFANSHDCKRFYRCVSNDKGGYTKYEFSCAEGTMWVQEIQACDYEDDKSNCTKKSPTSKPPSVDEQQNTSNSQSTISSSTSTTSKTPDKENDEYSDNNSDKPSGDENCVSDGFYPNSKDCKKFYRCVDNGQGGYTKYDFTCGEGTAWDTDIQNCNHISEVRSCSNQEESHKPIQDEEVSQTTESVNTSEHTESSKPTSKDTCEQEGYFGNTQDCKKFYRCVDNGKGGYTKYDYDCGEGTIWDQDVTTCNHPQDVINPSCKNSENGTPAPSGSSTTSSSSESESQSSTSSPGSSNESSSNCSQEDSNKKPDKQKITCEKAGYFPNPNDCKKFYRCVDWDGDGQRFSVYHFECGEGTIWDPQLETCNHEDSVYPPRDCSSVQSQNENNMEDFSTTETSNTTKEDSSESNTQQSTTTEQSTTTDKTTTESTTTQGTTTQQPSSAESTVSESTTTEETTSQQATTTESTTTESTTTQKTTSTSTTESTTTESTTTKVPTTTESTTTESTTTQGTTTSESTTTESTTTQGTTTTTTTESTTTQQSTTEGSTTEKSTTNEEASNQETTTEENTTTTTQQTTQNSDDSNQTTTTEHSTSSEETTSQQSTTSEQTTTNEQTTQKSTTEESTTTTEQTGMQETSTESTDESTTQSNTTDEGTTEQLTTEEQTTTEESDSQITDESTTTTTEQSDNASTTEDNETTTEAGEDSTTEESSSSSKECPDTEDDQYLYVCPTSFRRHPKYCNMFYQCTEDDDSHELKIAVFTCPNNTIYDESKTQCVEEDKADKECNGEIAQRRRVKRLNKSYKEPILVGKQPFSCPANGYFSFEKDAECSPAFMKCQKAKSGKLRGFVHQCPEGYLYWSISKRCEKKENVTDCKRSSNDWSRRWEIPIERKNVA